jgi:hypothetical protein
MPEEGFRLTMCVVQVFTSDELVQFSKVVRRRNVTTCLPFHSVFCKSQGVQTQTKPVVTKEDSFQIIHTKLFQPERNVKALTIVSDKKNVVDSIDGVVCNLQHKKNV